MPCPLFHGDGIPRRCWRVSVTTQERSLRDLAVQLWSIEKLIPYARNARTHTDEQVAQIAGSIAEFGWTNPILVGADGIIIAGHARLAAARRLKMTQVPVIVLDDLTETQRRALILADNRLALNAGWDEEMLRVELAALKEDEFDLDLIGFTDEEMEDLLRDPEETREGLTDDDAVSTLSIAPAFPLRSGLTAWFGSAPTASPWLFASAAQPRCRSSRRPAFSASPP